MSNQTTKLYLIDGMSIVFRAYHALAASGLKAPNGEPTGAIFAFTNIITSLMEKYNPNNVAVIFDRAEPTFRHIKYPLYKANREEFPEDLVPQLSRIKELLDLLGIPRYSKAGFEADDVIGTLAKDASKEGWQVVCITSDKDYYQLVDENISLLKPGRRGEDFEIVNTPEVIEKFGVLPKRVIDVLGLIGDSSDNVPGIKGIGIKTAVPLIQEFDTIENIYENLDKIERASVKKKFESSREIADLSKYLVTIDVNVPLDFSINDCKINTINYNGLNEFFGTVGFNSIRERWRKKAFENGINTLEKIPESTSLTTNLETKSIDYILCSNLNDLDKLVEVLSQFKVLSFDLETDSLDRDTCEIVGISLSAEIGKAYYIPVEYFGNKNIAQKNEDHSLFVAHKEVKKIHWEESLDVYKVLDKLKQVFENKDIGKVGQNIKFDAYIINRHGYNVSPITFDTMVAAYIIDADQKHNLDALAKKYLNYNTIPITNLIGKKKSSQISMRSIAPNEVKDYACEDADIAFRLMNALKPIIEKEELSDISYKIDFPLIEVLTEMELAGVSIDTKALSEISIIINDEISKLKKLIFAESGIEFNIDSPKQLADILFLKMQIPPLKKNKTGYSTDVQVLSELSISYPIAKYVLEYRQIHKLLTTYVDALPKLINPNTNRIHTTYNQTVVSTGRLSSTEPNLQNIPIRTDLGKEIRKAFVAKSDEYTLLSADYSQIELRIMAYMSKDAPLIDAFQHGKDIHSATAAILNNIDISEVNPDMRRTAKTVNFGIMYGLGSFGLSQRLGISRSEAKNIIENYFEKYPGIKKYMEDTIQITRERGYTETLCGRRKYYYDINNRNSNIRSAAERAAINMPIQGTASDMLKLAMISIHKFIKENKLVSKMLLQVHDELVFEVQKSELDFLKENIIKLMDNALLISPVPVIVEVGTGSNWFEAH